MKSLKLSPVAVGLAIRTLREDAKMSSSDLAKQVGMTPSSLSRTENGIRSLELAESELIANAVGATINEVLRVARHLQDSGAVKQRELALAEYQRSLSEVKDVAALAVADLKKSLEAGE